MVLFVLSTAVKKLITQALRLILFPGEKLGEMVRNI
jgi:hypothetical protein